MRWFRGKSGARRHSAEFRRIPGDGLGPRRRGDGAGHSRLGPAVLPQRAKRCAAPSRSKRSTKRAT